MNNATTLENGHVVRLRSDHSVIGNVRFANRVEDRLFIDDPAWMAQGDVVRVLWADGRRDTDESPNNLDVHVREGRRLVWVRGS